MHVRRPLGSPGTIREGYDEAGGFTAKGAEQVKCYCFYPWLVEQVALTAVRIPSPVSAGVRAPQRASLGSSQAISSDADSSASKALLPSLLTLVQQGGDKLQVIQQAIPSLSDTAA